MRGIRSQMDSLITGLPQKEMAAMALGLAHRYITISPTLYVFDMVHFLSLLWYCTTFVYDWGQHWCPQTIHFIMIVLRKKSYKIIVLQQYSYCLFLAVTEQLLAHLSWKHKLAFLNKICLLSVGVGIVVNFSHFHHFLLQNPWADFNQTWHKALLDEGD